MSADRTISDELVDDVSVRTRGSGRSTSPIRSSSATEPGPGAAIAHGGKASKAGSAVNLNGSNGKSTETNSSSSTDDSDDDALDEQFFLNSSTSGGGSDSIRLDGVEVAVQVVGVDHLSAGVHDRASSSSRSVGLDGVQTPDVIGASDSSSTDSRSSDSSGDDRYDVDNVRNDDSGTDEEGGAHDDEAGPLPSRFDERYVLTKRLLGKGQSSVRLGFSRRSGESVAVKVVRRDERDDDTVREAAIVRSLRHDNIVRLHRQYCNSKYRFLVFELLKGQDLCDVLTHYRWLPDAVVAHYGRQMLAGLLHAQRLNIVHRDIKAENVVITTDEDDATEPGTTWQGEPTAVPLGKATIIDWGFAVEVDESTSGVCGSVYYIAPELVRVQLGRVKRSHIDVERIELYRRSDSWSCGVLFFLMLTNTFPFGDDIVDVVDVFHAIVDQPLVMPDHLSPNAADLLRRMLDKDPARRLSMTQALEHPFFARNTVPRLVLTRPTALAFPNSARLRQGVMRSPRVMLGDKRIIVERGTPRTPATGTPRTSTPGRHSSSSFDSEPAMSPRIITPRAPAPAAADRHLVAMRKRASSIGVSTPRAPGSFTRTPRAPGSHTSRRATSIDRQLPEHLTAGGVVADDTVADEAEEAEIVNTPMDEATLHEERREAPARSRGGLGSRLRNMVRRVRARKRQRKGARASPNESDTSEPTSPSTSEPSSPRRHGRRRRSPNSTLRSKHSRARRDA